MGRHREFDEAEVVGRAMDAFWALGYRATTPQKLVEATGLSRSSLYATFENKQGIFRAALERYIDDQAALLGALLEEGTLREGLERMYGLMVGVLTAPRDARCCLLASSTLEVPEDAGAEDLLADAGRRLEAVFEARFARAVAEGELPADRDPRALARFVVSSNMGLQVTGRRDPDPERLRAITGQVVDAICGP